MIKIIKKLEENNIAGMGGAGYPTASKWKAVKKAESDIKYIICNAAEGEPGIRKDKYILENYLEKVVDGMNIAKNYLEENGKNYVKVKLFIFLNYKYYHRLKDRVDKILKEHKIFLFVKPSDAGYIAGEETSLLNAIEGSRIEPRLKSPYPTVHGLWDRPTIVNNVETFYNVSLVNSSEYDNERFYTISGDCKNIGVYKLSNKITIEKVLKETDNFLEANFFVQVGGDASGSILNKKQLRKKVFGAGSITIYKMKNHNPVDIIKNWVDFYLHESCGQCVTGREGIFRLDEILKGKTIKWGLFFEILNLLEQTSFCALCRSAPVPIKSYVKNVLAKEWDEKINISKKKRDIICSIFK